MLKKKKKIIQVDPMNIAQSSNSIICSQANPYVSDREESQYLKGLINFKLSRGLYQTENHTGLSAQG